MYRGGRLGEWRRRYGVGGIDEIWRREAGGDGMEEEVGIEEGFVV